MAKSTEVNLDFSETETRGGKKGRGARPHLPEGDYVARVKSAKMTTSAEKKTPGIELELAITAGKQKGKVLRDTLWLSESAMWKVRQAMEGMGLKVPSKRVKVDIAKFKGKDVAIALEDEEYNDKVYSKVVDYFLVSEIADDDDEVDEDDEEDDDTEPDEDDEGDDLEGLDLDDI